MTDEPSMDADDLRAFYGEPSLLARNKVLPRLDHHCRDFIARSPFLVLGTADAQGNQDVSPRGDPPGFVKVMADGRLAIPDRPGNRRVDSLTNIALSPKVALLFMVPGFDETVRVNGRAEITRDPALLEALSVKGRPAVAAILVEVDEAFFHCAKSLIRSALWDPATRADRRQMPSLGQIIADQIDGVDPEAADEVVEESNRTRLY
ncbi:MAG TPA: pyridoxamine 5'-phosphate oxidase family protein [Gaiellales bacterium]|nr:pyridoxamine 5'-phosphate oxidase family protein [Gaiellales bacterium]